MGISLTKRKHDDDAITDSTVAHTSQNKRDLTKGLCYTKSPERMFIVPPFYSLWRVTSMGSGTKGSSGPHLHYFSREDPRCKWTIIDDVCQSINHYVRPRSHCPTVKLVLPSIVTKLRLACTMSHAVTLATIAAVVAGQWQHRAWSFYLHCHPLTRSSRLERLILPFVKHSVWPDRYSNTLY